MLSAFRNALSWIVGIFVSGMKYLICAVIEAFLYWLKAALEAAFEACPDPWEQWIIDYGSAFFKWFVWGDQYLPLSEMFSLILMYYAWCVVCSIVAWAMKMLRG